MKFVCPLPPIWADIHAKLSRLFSEHQDIKVEPPRPLILNGWAFSSDKDKLERWEETVKWAERYGFEHNIPTLKHDQMYCVDQVDDEIYGM